MLTRKETVFQRINEGLVHTVLFACTDNEDTGALTALKLDRGVYHKMGDPKFLTVTIRGGDVLDGINNESHNNG